jgi:hypothetical protein
MTSQTISVELAGLGAEITSSFGEFVDYARLHLEPLLVPSQGRARISATLRWHEGRPPERSEGDPRLRDMERIDRDLYRSDGQLAWFRIDDLPGLQLRFEWSGERLRVEGDYYFRLSADGKRDSLKRLVYRGRLPALQQTRERFGDSGWELHYNVFGRNGIMGDMEPLKDRPGHELCLVVQGVAPTREMAEEVAMTGTRQLFYARLPEVKGTAGGVAFVLDEVMPATPAYRWTLNHTVAVDSPMELFPTYTAIVGS